MLKNQAYPHSSIDVANYPATSWKYPASNYTEWFAAFSALSTGQTEVAATFGTFGGGGNLYRSSCLAPNGKIYCPPYSATNIGIIDPSTDTFSTMASGLTDGSYMSSVLAWNGKIYCAPLTLGSGSGIIEIDPTTDTMRIIIGNGFGTGTQKWIGGTLANNGKIYYAPYDSPNILEFDPATDRIRLIDISGVTAGTAKFRGAQLAPNGKIWLISYTTSVFGIFDPADDSYTTVAHGLGAGPNFERCTIYQYIHAMRADTGFSQIARIDPATNAIVTYAATGSLAGTVLGATKNVYGVPWTASAVVKHDTTTFAVSTFGSLGATAAKWAGGSLAFNGAIYAPPFNATTCLKILSTVSPDLSEDIVLSRYINKN